MPQCDLRTVTFKNFGSTSPPTRVFWWKNTKSRREGRLNMQIYKCDLSREIQWRFTVIATKFQIKYYSSHIFTKCFIYIPPESEKSASYTLFRAIWRLRRNALKCQLCLIFFYRVFFFFFFLINDCTATLKIHLCSSLIDILVECEIMKYHTKSM